MNLNADFVKKTLRRDDIAATLRLACILRNILLIYLGNKGNEIVVIINLIHQIYEYDI